jgi:multicomponent K+:H+ antiporter subunit G
MAVLSELLLCVLMLIGCFFLLVSAVGMLRLPDLYTRLHAPGNASTLCLGSFLLASMFYSALQGRYGCAELLITLLAFISAPVSANLLAQAAIHLKLRSMSGEVPEALNRPLPWQKRSPPDQ